MSDVSKPIRLSGHAEIQCVRRGATEKEIRDTITSSKWQKAELDKFECRKDFIYSKIWNNKLFKTKQVRPIFAEEENEIVVVTVYVYYF